MGTYLSIPNREKVSDDYEGKVLSYGASCMQGWRSSQEDAHNCEVDFDKDTSFFAVYDGHGGAEVARYTASQLPSFLRDMSLYKEGRLQEALVQAFLDFDASLLSDPALQQLKQLTDHNSADESEELNEASLLKQDAQIPIEQLMQKYGGGKQDDEEDKEEDKDKDKKEEKDKNKKEEKDKNKEEEKDKNIEKNKDKGEEEVKNKEQKCGGDAVLVNGMMEVEGEKGEEEGGSGVAMKRVDGKEGKNGKVVGKAASTEQNGGGSGEVKEGGGSGEVKEGGGSGEMKEGGGSGEVKEGGGGGGVKEEEGSGAKEEGGSGEGTSSKSLKDMKPQCSKAPSGEGDEDEEEEDEDESDSDFEEEKWKCEDEDDDEIEVDCSSYIYKLLRKSKSTKADGDEEDDDDDEEEEEEDEDGGAAGLIGVGDKPAIDSGCTAVVALLRCNDLFVANAGDSRCVVCRDKEAVDMSLDHKPEDEEEKSRIERAGGKITADGRVNGGLNLSRAIGDHAYKQNGSLSLKEQMITSLPDIKHLQLHHKDRFMVIACDGIWNVLSSQEVVDFVSERLVPGRTLSSICEELFDFCLAPDTSGDGTGCDNMTCIIVLFHSLPPAPTPTQQEETLGSEVDVKKKEEVVNGGVRRKREEEEEGSEVDASKAAKKFKPLNTTPHATL